MINENLKELIDEKINDKTNTSSEKINEIKNVYEMFDKKLEDNMEIYNKIINNLKKY